jgi:hypothetical protein
MRLQDTVPRMVFKRPAEAFCVLGAGVDHDGWR